MTQDELALKIGYKSGSSINKIELGLADIPQSKIKKFAIALQTEPSYLLNWDENKEMIYDYQSELKNRALFEGARNNESMVLMFDSSSKDLEVALANCGINVISLSGNPAALDEYLYSNSTNSMLLLSDLSKNDLKKIVSIVKDNKFKKMKNHKRELTTIKE